MSEEKEKRRADKNEILSIRRLSGEQELPVILHISALEVKIKSGMCCVLEVKGRKYFKKEETIS